MIPKIDIIRSLHINISHFYVMSFQSILLNIITILKIVL